jgi:putative sterol carrier protein
VVLGSFYRDDLEGQPDLLVQAHGATWIAFLRKQRNLLLALLTGRSRLRGNPQRLLRFARCFAV